SARVAARNHVPIAIRGPPDSEIRLPVAIVVSRHGNVSGYPPQLVERSARVAAGNDVPFASRGPTNAHVRLLISIKVDTCARRGRLKCSDQVQPAMAHIGADGHRMSQSGGGPCLVDVGLPTPQQSSGPRNEGRAEGGSPSGGVGAKR